MENRAGDAPILDVLDIAVVVYGPDRRVVHASSAISNVLGFDAAAIVGTPFTIPLLAGGSFPKSWSAPQKNLIVAATADGGPAWLDVGLRQLPDGRIVLTAQPGDATAGDADILQRMDAQGRTTWISKSVEELTGWPITDCLGDTRFDMVHPEDADRAADLIGSLRSGQRRSGTVEIRMRHQIGSYLWWSVSAHCVGDDPATSDIEMAFRNIDRETTLARQMARDESAIRSVLDNALDPVAALSPVRSADGRIIDLFYAEANPAALHVLRRTASDLIGRPLSEVLPPAAAAELVALCQRSSSVQRPVTLRDHPLAGPDPEVGRRRYDLRVWTVADRVLITWRDVTERPLISDSAVSGTDALVRLDVSGRIEWVSPAVHDLLGWDDRELIGTIVGDLVHAEDRAGASGKRHRARMRTKSGRWLWIEVNERPITAADGRVVSRLWELQDVGLDVRREHDVDAERTRLRAAFEAALDPFVLLTAMRDQRERIVDFRYVAANEAACRSSGMSRAELLSKTVLGVFPEQEALGLIAQYAAVVDTGDQLILETFTYPHRTTQDPRRIDIRAVRIDDGVALTWRDVTERAVAADLLVQSQTRLALMLDTMAEGVVVHNLDGDVVESNRAARLILGVPDGELLGNYRSSRYVLVDAEGQPLAMGEHPIERALATGERVQGVVMGLHRPDGTLLWLQVSSELLPGEPAGVLSTFSDITDSITAERALRRSEERYRLLAENASEVVVQTGPDRCIIWVSPSIQTVLGYQPREVVGRRLSDFMLAEDVERLQQAMARNVAEHRTSGEARMRLRTADGGTRWMSLLGRALVDGQGQVIGGVDALRDIDEQVMAQTGLEVLLDAIAEGVVVLDRSGTIIECNPAALSILGMPESALVGQVVADEDWPTVDERGEVLPGIRHPAVVALRTGEPVRDQVIGFVRPDGEVSWLLVSANPIRDTQPGEVSRVVTTFVNITGRIEAQRSLAEAESRYRLLAENATDFVVFADLEGILRWTSPSVERMIGWSPGEVIGKSLLDFIHPDDLAKLPGRSERLNAGVLSRRLRLRFRDGSWGWFLASSKPVADDDGTLIGRVTGLQDVQSEMQARLELSQAHQRLELVLDSSRLGVWDWNIQTGELVLNERWAEIVGYQLAELSPVDISTWTKLVHPDDGAASSAAIAAHAGGASPFYDLDLRMRHREGHWVWVRDRGRIVEWDDQGRPLRMTGTHEDITELRVAARALAASEERFRVAMASAPVGMAVLDLQRRVQQVNPALCALLDRPEEWLVGRSMDEIIVESDVVMDASARRRLLDSDETSITVDHRVHRGNHTQIWVQQSISLVRGSGGEVAGYVSQFTDITEARRARHMLRDLAARDPLTELYNRREFTVLVKRLQEANAVDRLTLLFIDLDGLKQVNDTYGHLVGDEVIQEQSQRLLAVVRASDLVARFGGDEFVVMAVDLVGDREVADFARRIHEATRQPIRIGDDLLEVTCSIGVATMDADTDLEELLARADAALYDAKRGGRDRVAVANLPPL